MTNLKVIGKRVRALRTAKPGNLTQEQLAAEIGVTRSAIAGIETGGDRGGIETMIAIADYYKVPMDWLLSRSVPPGGPLSGEFVNDADELAWIHFWRNLSEQDRLAALRMLRIPERRAE